MNITPKELLGQLVKNSQITEKEAQQFEVASLQKNLFIIDYLYQYTQVPRIEIVKARSVIEMVPFVDLEKIPIDSQAVGLISESITRRYQIIPYRFDPKESAIYIGTEEPSNTSIIDFLEKKNREKKEKKKNRPLGRKRKTKNKTKKKIRKSKIRNNEVEKNGIQMRKL